MAWNEPGGGNGNKDPWGGGGGQKDGPPDLDEALKKLQEKLNSIFGGGGGGASTASGGPSPTLIALILVVLAVIWGAMGFYTVEEKERAVVLRLGVFNEIKDPGLRWNPPLIDSVTKVNKLKVRSHSHSAQMLTEDENIVEVSLSVQYKAESPKDFLLEVRNPERSLAQATESALRHVVGSSDMHQVLTEGRAKLAIDVQDRLQRLINIYNSGIRVTKVNIEATQPPAQVQAAFDDVQKAKEDEQRAKNEAESYANAVVPEARGKAQRQIEEANGYKERVIARAEGEAVRFKKLLAEYKKAPEVTRERLYLDAVEDVLKKTNKIMVDVEGGNNMMYLPLDKLVSRQNQPTAAPAVPTPSVRELTDRVLEQLRRDSQVSRRREVR